MKSTQRLFQWMGWTKKDELPLYDSNVILTSPSPSPPRAMWYAKTVQTPTQHTQFTFNQKSPQSLNYSHDPLYPLDLENQNQSEPHQITEGHVRLHCCSLCTMIKRIFLRRVE